VLTSEQVDRLREMAGRLLRQSPDYQRLLRDLGVAANAQQPRRAAETASLSWSLTKERHELAE
jgi:hypothetical protein